MYPPFEFNDLLGPLLVLAFFATTFKLVLVLGLLKGYFRKEEDSFRG